MSKEIKEIEITKWVIRIQEKEFGNKAKLVALDKNGNEYNFELNSDDGFGFVYIDIIRTNSKSKK